METYEANTNGDVLAIAHNGNLSNGIMFPETAQWNGRKLDEAYVNARSLWEPVYEATQIKGDGESHPFLSPNDEFANYENWDKGNLNLSELKTDDMLKGEYAREALKTGLKLEDRLGINPYKFGHIGSTDSHTSLSTAEEDNFFGKHTGYEPSPHRMEHPMMESADKTLRLDGWQLVASGLAAVWTTENTREAIWNAAPTFRVETEYADGLRMTIGSSESPPKGAPLDHKKLLGGTKWYGENGQWIYVNRGRFDSNPANLAKDITKPRT